MYVESHASAVSLLNSGEQRYIKAISKQTYPRAYPWPTLWPTPLFYHSILRTSEAHGGPAKFVGISSPGGSSTPLAPSTPNPQASSVRKDLLKAMEKMGALSAHPAGHNVHGVGEQVQVAHFVG